MTTIDPDKLYSETEAARLLGLKSKRSLRTERTKGRIGYKPVAGKIMYRGRDLTAWLNDGVEPWRDEEKAPGSPPGS